MNKHGVRKVPPGHVTHTGRRCVVRTSKTSTENRGKTIGKGQKGN